VGREAQAVVGHARDAASLAKKRQPAAGHPEGAARPLTLRLTEYEFERNGADEVTELILGM
jgi:hypothetical protein